MTLYFSKLIELLQAKSDS